MMKAKTGVAVIVVLFGCGLARGAMAASLEEAFIAASLQEIADCRDRPADPDRAVRLERTRAELLARLVMTRHLEEARLRRLNERVGMAQIALGQ